MDKMTVERFNRMNNAYLDINRIQRIDKCISDIKDIARLLDPVGMSWADAEKARREAARLPDIEPPPIITRSCEESIRDLEELEGL